MATVKELHNAIINGFTAVAKDLADKLRANGVNISEEIKFAKKLAKIKGGTWIVLAEEIA